MLFRSITTALAVACLAGLLFAAHSTAMGLGEEQTFSLVGLAGLGAITLRSEGRRRGPESA